MPGSTRYPESDPEPLRGSDGSNGLQSIAQVSSHYGQGEARTIIENCSNSVIFRCAASEGGGTARFASQLVGEREIIRTTRSMSRRYDERIGSITDSEQINVEPALLPSQIEQLPDLTAYLKYASNPVWQRVLLSPPRSAASERPPPAPETPQKLSDREARDRSLKHDDGRDGLRQKADATEHQHGGHAEGEPAEHEAAHGRGFNVHRRTLA